MPSGRIAVLVELDVEVAYAHGPTVRASFSLHLPPGGIAALVGPSGAGKTTVLRALAGLERPRRGTIRVDGRYWFDAAQGVNLPPQHRRTGLIFQDYALYPHRSVAGNVSLAVAAGGAKGAAAQRRVRELLELVGLWEERDRYPQELSGGQRQRLAIARALACGAQLLLLDEPFAALDPITRRQVRSQLLELLRSSGVVALLVGHEWAEIATDAQMVVVMAERRVVQCGEPAAIARAPACRVVAELIGYENVFPVRRVGYTQGATVEAVLRGDLRLLGRLPLPSLDHRPHWCCIHPEALELCVAGSPEGVNRWAATVLRIEQAASPPRVVLEDGERLWVAHAPRSIAAALRPAQTVHLHVPPEAVWVLPDLPPRARD